MAKAKWGRKHMMKKRNLKRLRTEMRVLYDEIANIAEADMEAEFERAFEEDGELLEFIGSQEDLGALVSSAMQQYFGPADEDRPNALQSA